MHKDQASGNWYNLTLAQQLGNIGSEVGRAIKWQKKGNPDRMERTLVRAFELLDLTISDKRWRSMRRLRELCRSREVLADIFYGKNIYKSTPESIERYFYHYALMSRKNS